MLWLRGLIFTLLVPLMVGGYVPHLLWRERTAGPWAWFGWPLVALGAAIYLRCLHGFLAAGGTPSIWFARPLRHLLGEEPGSLVRSGLYRWSRNPMYVGVVTAIVGQAIVFESRAVATYAVVFWLAMQFFVTRVEEPHLRRKLSASYDDYCRRVPRWI
jgi:protein-S-isoprenylcysteine O-methyltransferase Ste14